MAKWGLVVVGVLVIILVPLLLPGILWPYDGLEVCRGDLVTSGSTCQFSWAKLLGVVAPGLVVGAACIVGGLRIKRK